MRLPLGRYSSIITVAVLGLAGCGGQPIDFERWGLDESLPVAAPDILAAKIERLSERMFREHVAEEGVLLYRVPVDPKAWPAGSSYLDLADQATWTGFLLAGLAFEYRVEPTPRTLARLRQVVAGMEALEAVTGVRGLIARAIVPLAAAQPMLDRGEPWRRGEPVVRNDRVVELVYRGDVSKDQYAGYVFGLICAATLVDDDDVHRRCAALLERCALFVDRGDLRIIDVDGETTRFGNLAGRIAGVPIGVNAAIALEILLGGQAFGRRPDTADAAARHVDQLLGCLRPLYFEVLGIGNYSNAVMAAAGVGGVALVAESQKVVDAIHAAYVPFTTHFVGEGGALIYGIGRLMGIENRREEQRCLANLYHVGEDTREAQLPLAIYQNSQARLLPDRRFNRRSCQCNPLRCLRRTSFRWKTDPYDRFVDRGETGEIQAAPVDVYVAYWLGRFTGWIPSPGTELHGVAKTQ